jgi:predicted nucleic-acid-binding protein
LPTAYVRERLQFSNKKISSTKVISNEKMIKLVRLAARQEGFNIQQNATISTTQATQLYEATKAKFEYPAIHERTRRHESIGWKTYYNIMAKNRWKFVGDV